jgi:hypothetical protein
MGLLKKNFDSKTKKRKILIKISFGSEFLKYLVDNKSAIHELNSMLSIIKERHWTYAQLLLSISELSIPLLDIDRTIRLEYLGFHTDSRTI